MYRKKVASYISFCYNSKVKLYTIIMCIGLTTTGCASTNIRPVTEPINKVKHTVENLNNLGRQIEVTCRQLGGCRNTQKGY